MSPTRQPRLGSVVWAEVEDVRRHVAVLARCGLSRNRCGISQVVERSAS